MPSFGNQKNHSDFYPAGSKLFGEIVNHLLRQVTCHCWPNEKKNSKM